MPIVRIVSQDHRPWNLRFQQENTVIPPHGVVYVEWDRACFWLGDPGTLEERRRDEYNRKRTWYGFQEGFHTEDVWEELRPKLEVFDQNTGERIYMVLDDPAGTAYSTAASPAAGPDPFARIAELEAKIELLLAGQQANGGLPPVPTDAATAVAGFQFTDPDGNPIDDALPPLPADDAAAIPSADASTAGALADTPQQVPTGRRRG